MARALLVALPLLLAAPAAHAAGDPATAALEFRLRGQGLYDGPVDGIGGPRLEAAVLVYQRRAGLPADGIAGPRTRAALGARPLGARLLGRGNRGWDAAELQFLLAEHGFPSGVFGTVFGLHVERALKRFQRFAGLVDDGLAGRATLAALRRPPPLPPLRLRWPLAAPVGDPFGPRGGRWHSGIDLEAEAGAPVAAAAAGRVSWAAWLDGGWGLLVTVAHGGGARTMYAHLSRVDVVVGQHVAAGDRLGLVGATGDATGPHLHFELRVRGAAVDPRPALP